jgi:hypothetical protein
VAERQKPILYSLESYIKYQINIPKTKKTITGIMSNHAQNNLSIPLPDLIRAIIVALQHLGIEISPSDIDNNGKSSYLFYSQH